MQTLNQTQFAKHLGYTKGYVSQLKSSGRLVFAENGLVDVEASNIKIAETADPNRDDVKARHAIERSEKTVRPAEKTKKTKDPNQVTFSDGRAKEQHYKALNAEIEYKKTINELVSKADMQAAVIDLVTAFRQELENLPHRIGADLVGKDLADIRSAIKRSVHDVLQNLERGFEKKMNNGAPE